MKWTSFLLNADFSELRGVPRLTSILIHRNDLGLLEGKGRREQRDGLSLGFGLLLQLVVSSGQNLKVSLLLRVSKQILGQESLLSREVLLSSEGIGSL